MKDPSMDAYMSRFRSRQHDASKRICSICGQAFARTEHLTRHERSHRGEKPFRCSFCGFAFCRKDLLKRHVVRKHSSVECATTATDTNEARGAALQHRDDPAKEMNQFNFDSVLGWGSDLPDCGSLNSQSPAISNDLSSVSDMDLGNFISGVYNGFQIDGPFFIPPSNAHWDISPQPSSVTSTKTGNEFGKTLLGTFRISETKRTQLKDLGQEACSGLDLALPSCFTLERCLAACFDSLFPVTPCVHLPTWTAENADPCLLLAMAACGAKYLRRTELARNLQKLARKMVLAQIQTTELVRLRQPPSIILSLLIVIGFSIWDGPADACREAMMDNVLLAELSCLETEPSEDINASASSDPEDSWEEWVERETMIRTRYSVLYFLCLVSTTFDVPPLIRCSDVKLSLPCTEVEWMASNAHDWTKNRRPTATLCLKDAFDGLFHASTSLSTPAIDSPFTGILILHTLIQQIWFCRQGGWGVNRDLDVGRFRNVLDNLESAGSFASESTISPHNFRAGLAYNFHSLLRLARIYLCANMGKFLFVCKSHDVSKISHAISVGFPIERCVEASQAALSATQSFAVLLRSGASHTSASGTLHYIFNAFQSALYLIKWLELMEKISAIIWFEHESETILSIESTVKEVDLPPEQAEMPLSAQVAFACSIVFKGAETWGLQSVLLKAVHEYAEKSYADRKRAALH